MILATRSIDSSETVHSGNEQKSLPFMRMMRICSFLLLAQSTEAICVGLTYSPHGSLINMDGLMSHSQVWVKGYIYWHDVEEIY